MASSPDQPNQEKEKPPSPAMAGGKKKKKTTAGRKVRMTQEEIDIYINYQTIRMPDEIFPIVSKERLACTDLSDKGDLPVTMDQIDDYVAKIFREINQIEDQFMKHRDGILNQYYRKGYAMRKATDDDDDEEEEEETSPADAQEEDAGDEQARAPNPGRRRFRPGVSIKAGKVNKLN